jgi:hypothetical protein
MSLRLAAAQPALQVEPTAVPPDPAVSIAVVPAGQDELFAEIFGRGEVLPGECRWLRGEGDGRTVRTTYGCPDGEVVFELRHPSQLKSPTFRTKKFAGVLLAGLPPAGLADALRARIEDREAAFEWAWISAPPRRYSRGVLMVVVPLLALIALWSMLRRRRSAA